MPQPGMPYSPDDSDDERSFMAMMPLDQLPPPDLSGGVQLADREGVFGQSFKCRACTLHFVLFSWSRTRHRPETIACPECGSRGRFIHYTTELSASQQFRMDPSRDPEIYDVWPFRTGGTR